MFLVFFSKQENVMARVGVKRAIKTFTHNLDFLPAAEIRETHVWPALYLRKSTV